MPISDTFTAYDGLTLFSQTWLPTIERRATIIFVHGLLEHSGCHVRMAEELNAMGIAFHAMDLRGHGRSGGPRCDVKRFDDYLLDLDSFVDRVRQTAGDGPCFLMGNSMGGLVSSLWTITRQPKIDGLILSGPLLELSPTMFPRLRPLALTAAKIVPWLRAVRVPVEWIASDPEAREHIRRDPLFFHGRFTVRMGAEIIRSIDRLHHQASELRVPLLIMHGGNDKICWVRGSERLVAEASSTDKTLHVYDGFAHEIFDEPERDRAARDFHSWIEQHVPRKPIAVSRGASRL